ncbi:Dolichyl-diphosphooligosaccharide--protein glycosyltransferase subunit [Candida viswanathii]|uniref:Dolichyl-diphosphooligosaccharide--protein glycosyltransferase subunit n=1 Tax=Candida viswanathii TaxID=5486 RepID=A0A367YP85_9ASCO|nr:Dolichyl-diphosphooligosaccharide--protein glycosyltransferase subunit [Candida viswanathii]
MITDDQLNTIALTFGFSSIILIIIYHAISTNTKKLQESNSTATATVESNIAAEELVAGKVSKK